MGARRGGAAGAGGAVRGAAGAAAAGGGRDGRRDARGARIRGREQAQYDHQLRRLPPVRVKQSPLLAQCSDLDGRCRGALFA